LNDIIPCIYFINLTKKDTTFIAIHDYMGFTINNYEKDFDNSFLLFEYKFACSN
jgi:hypothetical protein